MMRAFVCVGFAIIASLMIISVIAERCLECCNGEPCNPELRAAFPSQQGTEP